MKYLQLIRYKNLIMIAIMQLIVLFCFLKMQEIPLALALWQYYLLVIATICITAGGYIINDIFDQDADAINKPKKKIVGSKISENQAYNLYVGFTLTGVSIGFYLSNIIMRPAFVTVFILCAALLYLYATSLKQIVLLKNVIVSLLLAFSIIIIGLYMIFPATDYTNRDQMRTVFSVLIDFSIIAFILNFLREIVKDIQDVKGDYNHGVQTLPIILGIDRTLKLVFGLTFIPIVLILSYIYLNLFELIYATLYLLGFVIGPLLYFVIKIWNANSQKDYQHLSNTLKLVVFFGILSIGVIGINMYYHAS